MTRKINTIPPKRLAETITAAATSFKLNDILGFDGVALTESIIGDTVYCSFQDTTGRYLELMKIDPATIASASITILKRGLSFNEDGTETEVAGNKRQWIKNQTIVNLGTDTPAMFNNYVKVADNQTVAGVKTFSSSPIVPTPTTDLQAATKKYVDDGLALKLDDSQLDIDPALTADSDSKIPSQKAVKKFVEDTSYNGTVDADEDTKGIVEIATDAEAAAGTNTGGTTAPLVIQPSQLSLISNSSLVAGEDLAANDAVILASGSEYAIVSAYSTTNTVRDSTNGWWYQSFTTGPNTTKIKSVILRVDGGGVNGTYTVTLRATPTGSNLITPVSLTENVSDADRTFDFGSGVSVSPSTTYYIVMTGLGYRGGTTSSYSGGVSGTSSTSGASWTTPATTVTGDFYFKVYEMYTTAGKVYKSSADSTNYHSTNFQNNFIGFNKNLVTSGNTATIQNNNVYKLFSGLTPGSTYYLSNTPGAISTSAGTVSKKIGLALSATDLLIKHDN